MQRREFLEIIAGATLAGAAKGDAIAAEEPAHAAEASS
jgi:hypothetical protein